MADIQLPIDAMQQALRTALVRSQEPITAYVGYSYDDATIDVPGISNLIYIYGVDGQPETAHAYFQPIKIPYAALNHRTQVVIKKLHGNWWVESVAYEGFLEQLGGGIPESNMLGMVHTHESDIQGGTLAADLVFSSGAVQAIYGGTGQSVYAVGDLLYASTTTALSRLADVATGNAVISGGVGVAPAWGKIGLTTHISGTLPVANGGTGAAALTANNVILGNGTSAVQFVAPGTSGNVLTSNGTTWQSTAPAASGGWTDDGTVVRLTTSTDNVTIGSASNVGKLGIVGDTDEVQFLVRGFSTQSNDIVRIENDTSQELFTITNTLLVINETGTNRDFRLESGGDNALIFADGSANRVGISTVGPAALLEIDGRADEIQLIVSRHSTQTGNIVEVQDSGAGVLLSIDSLGGMVVNESGAAATTRIETDNDPNAFIVNGTTDRVGIGDSTPDGRFAVVGRADEVQAIFRGNATQTSNTLEIQNSGSTVVASVNNTGQISGVQLGLTSAVASTTTPNILIRDTAQNFGHAKGSGSTGLYASLDGMYSARTTDTTVTTKTSPGTLIASIVAPADFFRVQRQIRFEFSAAGEAANADNLLRLVVQDGSTTLIDTRSSTTSSVGSTRDIWGRVLITCRSVGATGSVFVSARMVSSIFSDAGGGRDPNTAADTIDTTGARTFNIRLYWAGTGAPTLTVYDDYFDIAG